MRGTPRRRSFSAWARRSVRSNSLQRMSKERKSDTRCRRYAISKNYLSSACILRVSPKIHGRLPQQRCVKGTLAPRSNPAPGVKAVVYLLYENSAVHESRSVRHLFRDSFDRSDTEEQLARGWSLLSAGSAFPLGRFFKEINVAILRGMVHTLRVL